MPDQTTKIDCKLHLVVTADHRLWPIDKKLLLLGLWCTPLDQKHIWAKYDAIVAEPFLADIDEQVANSAKLRDLEDRMLNCLSPALNQLHNRNFSQRDWKIILGNWLHRYVTVFFNRYYTLKNCIKNYNVNNATFYPINSYNLVTRTSDEFVMACNNPVWNSVLWRDIWIKAGFEKHQITFAKPPHQKCFTLNATSKDSFLKRSLFRLSSILNQNAELMIISPYLPKKIQIKMALRKLSFPQIWPKSRPPLKSEINYETRSQLRKQCLNFFEDKFEKTCVDLMFDVIPICYVEGFEEVRQNAKKLGFPKKPKTIFTSNNFDTDEEFKSWAVDQIHNGAKYVIGQHGASYGTDIIESPFNEEVVADRFITWGSHLPYPNSKAGFIFTFPYSGSIPYDKNGCILLVQLAPPFHRYYFDAFYTYQSYCENLESFYHQLPTNVKNDVKIRLPGLSSKSGTSDVKRWQLANPEIKIDNFSQSFLSAVSKSRVVIFTYFSTGVLESISHSVPTICFWKQPLENVNPEVRFIFKALMDVKILHDRHNHAAKHLSDIAGNIDEWWDSAEVVKCRNQFIEHFARHQKNPDIELLGMLTFDNEGGSKF